jgi:hypothetical protein
MSAPDTIYAKQYGNIVFTKAQQEGSRLRSTVTLKTGVNAEETYIDQLDAFAASAKGSRLSATNPEAISVTRRRIALQDYFIAKALDKGDDIRTIAEPSSSVMKNSINGMGRQIDDIIIAAFKGTAYTGKTGTTSTSFDSNNTVAVGSTNFTLTKWLAGIKILNANDTDPSDERFLIIGSSQLSTLLNTTQVTSSDYASVKALVNGQVDQFLGCKVIRSERLPKSGNNRSAFLYTKSGVGLAIGQDVISRVDELPDMHYAKQIYFSMSMGASRLEEAKCVEILCDETK